MQAIRVRKVVERDGEIRATGLPCKKGQAVEMILLIDASVESERPCLTARGLHDSALVGLWKDREDIGDSPAYARQLREQAQRRRG